MGDYDGALEQVEGIRRVLWNEQEKLFHHIAIEEPKEFNDISFWGGGNGWCAMAMAKLIDELPDDRNSDQQKIIGYCTDLLDGLLKHLRPSGLFYDKITVNNFEETALPGMVAFTIYTGIESGWLDPSYKEKADIMRAAVHVRVQPKL